MGQGGESWDFKKTRGTVQDCPRNIQKKRCEVREGDKSLGEKCLTVPGWAPIASQAHLQLQRVRMQREQVLLTLGGSAAPAAPLHMSLCSPNLAQLGSALGSYSWAGANAWWPSTAGHLPCHLSIM